MVSTTSPRDFSSASFSRTFRWSGYLLGFALGAFFDGILLHQVLQWHHLLSGLQGEPFNDIRVQILADGLFHLKAYLLALVGLGLLWRARGEFAEPPAGRLLLAAALIGFGVWHVLDAILSHWILGIHRIRMDAENVLLWDLIWFFVFGIAFIAAGWLLWRNTGTGGGAARGRRFLAPGLLALAVLIAGPVAALPPPDTTAVMVLFKPGTSAEAIMTALHAVDGRIIWADPSGELWAIDLEDPGRSRALYRHGALLVSNTFLPVGCLNWFQ
jgi:uncharacterized membrane protein